MPNHDQLTADAIREIANLLAAAHLRLRFPEPPTRLDSPETKSESCDSRLTA